ncbi:MAG: phosphoglycerate mutase [Candidatus Aenigmatarchaeota archaeon]
MPILMLVMDGLADAGWPTPLALAKKPNIDRLAYHGIVGTLDIGYRGYVNSDFGYLNLLGCYSEKTYPGRGYLEALGVGFKPSKDDICIRANWATLDKSGNILDRRAGRETYGLEQLAEKLNGMIIDKIKFTIIPSAGHRLVIIMSGKGLSEYIQPNDPLKIGVPVPEIRAKKQSAKATASILNKFLRKAHEILKKDVINKKRRWPANAILIRNVGRKKETSSFRQKWGLKGCCIAGIPIAKGVATWLGLDVIDVKGATGMPDTNLEAKFDATKNALKRYDFVWLHINATDILSHDSRPELKKRFIEKVDGYIGSLDIECLFCLTCDHGTASSPDFKAYRHLSSPVPWLISNHVKPDGINTFDERAALQGQRLKGNELMEKICKIYKEGL